MLRCLKSIDLNPLSTDWKGKSGKISEMWWQWREQGKRPWCPPRLAPQKSTGLQFAWCAWPLFYLQLYTKWCLVCHLFNNWSHLPNVWCFGNIHRWYSQKKRAYQVAEVTLKLLGKCFMFACMLVELKKSLKINVIIIFCYSFSFSRFWLKKQ